VALASSFLVRIRPIQQRRSPYGAFAFGVPPGLPRKVDDRLRAPRIFEDPIGEHGPRRSFTATARVGSYRR